MAAVPRDPTVPLKPRRKRRWAWRLFGIVVAVVMFALALIPGALSSDAARGWMLARANRVLAPGELKLTGLTFSWFGPTEIHGLVLKDPKGEAVLKAESGTWDRNLGQVLFGRPRLGMLRLDRAVVDTERDREGKIDLYEALRPVIRLEPELDLKIVVTNGKLRFWTAELAGPVTAEHFDYVMEILPAPKPISWRGRLTNWPVGKSIETLTVEGRYDPWQSQAGWPLDLDIKVDADSWPWSAASAPGKTGASGRLTGVMSASWSEGECRLKGEAAAVGINANETLPGGQGLKLERVDGVWEATRDPRGKWSVGRLSVSAKDPAGHWSARVTGKSGERGLDLSATLDYEHSAGPVPAEPVGLTARVVVPTDGEAIDLTELVATTRYGTLSASGSVEDPWGRRVAVLTGHLVPNWEVLNARLRAEVEPGAKVVGHPRAFRVNVPLGPDWRSALDGELGLAIDHADVFGLKVGPSELVVRARDGQLSIDPIEAVVNSGKVHIEPTLVLDGKAAPAITLGPDSWVKDVEVNDEVSRRVLAFVAPVLGGATAVRGKVSTRVEEAVFPLKRDAGGDVKFEGSVVFQNVYFTSGPVADGFLVMAGLDRRLALRLDQSVSLQVSDRRVRQRGLAVRLGNVSRVELDGWVDFDKTIDMTASLPITAAMVANRPVLSAIVEGTRLSVPIRGTIDRPTLDTEAGKLGLKEAGKTLLRQTVTRGLPSLFRKLMQPRTEAKPGGSPRSEP